MKTIIVRKKMNRQNVYETLKIDEGVKYEIYEDHLGLPTFGVGHLILDSDPEDGMEIGTKVSEERVKLCFEGDLDLAISECIILYDNWEELPGEVQEILVNMMFNLGRPRLTKFKKFNAAISRRDWQEASKEGRDSLWHRQVTNRAERLMKRLENVEGVSEWA
jgi:lysozyme